MIDFHWAFVAAGVLILLSVFGYAGLAADAGSGIGGGSKAPVGAVGDAPSKRTST